MAFEVTGKLYKKFDTAQITDSFKKREFVLEIENGMYSEYVKFQLIQDKSDLIESFDEGSQLTVHFNLKGKEYHSPQGEIKYFNNLNAWKIENSAAEAPAAPQKTASTGTGTNSFPATSDEPQMDITDDLPF